MDKNILLAWALSAVVTTGVGANEMSDQTNQAVEQGQVKTAVVLNCANLKNDVNTNFIQSEAQKTAEQLLAECKAKFETPAETTQRMRDEVESWEYTPLNPLDYRVELAPEPINWLVPTEFVKSGTVIWNNVLSPEHINDSNDAANLISTVTVERQWSAQNFWDELLMRKELPENTIAIVNTYLKSIKEKEVNQVLAEKTIVALITWTIVDISELKEERLLAYSQDLSVIAYYVGIDFSTIQRAYKTSTNEWYNIIVLNEYNLSKFEEIGVMFSQENIVSYNQQLTDFVDQVPVMESNNIQNEELSLAGVHPDVLPDVETLHIESQRYFMKYYTKYINTIPEDYKVRFGKDLVDAISYMWDIPEDAIDAFWDIADTYIQIDFSELITKCEEIIIRLDEEDRISNEEIALLSAENDKNSVIVNNKMLDVNWRLVDVNWRLVDSQWRLIDVKWKIIEIDKKIERINAMIASTNN